MDRLKISGKFDISFRQIKEMSGKTLIKMKKLGKNGAYGGAIIPVSLKSETGIIGRLEISGNSKIETGKSEKCQGKPRLE